MEWVNYKGMEKKRKRGFELRVNDLKILHSFYITFYNNITVISLF